MYSMTVPEGSDLTQTHAMQEQKLRGATRHPTCSNKNRDFGQPCSAQQRRNVPNCRPGPGIEKNEFPVLLEAAQELSEALSIIFRSQLAI